MKLSVVKPRKKIIYIVASATISTLTATCDACKKLDVDYMYTDNGEYKPCKDLFTKIFYHGLIKQLILAIINVLGPPKKQAPRLCSASSFPNVLII